MLTMSKYCTTLYFEECVVRVSLLRMAGLDTESRLSTFSFAHLFPEMMERRKKAALELQ